MAIGKHEPKIAGNTHLTEAIGIGLDDVLISLEESFYDLTDEHFQGFPIAGENNVAWIVMHCLDNLDDCAIGAQTGGRLLPEEPRWKLWSAPHKERPKPGDPFPTVQEMLGVLVRLRESAVEALDRTDELALVAKSMPHPLKPTRSDFYMRTIYHTESHVRQIWLLRGALGLGDGLWPSQHWA